MKLNIKLTLILSIAFNSIVLAQKDFSITQDEFVLQLSKNQGLDSRFIQFDVEKNEILRSVEYPTYAIEIFDSKTGRLTGTVKPKISKLDVFLRNDGHYWVHNPWTQTYVLINDKGDVLKELREDKQSDDSLINIYSGGSAFSPISVYKNNLYVTGRINIGKSADIKPDVFARSGIVEKINIGEGIVSKVGRPARASLTKFYGYLNAYSVTLNKNLLVIAPFFSNEIQVLNLDKNTLKTIPLTIKNAPVTKPLGEISQRNEFKGAEQNSHAAENIKSVGIVYDSYRDIYYRFVSGAQQGFSNKQWTIVVLDKELKYIFEKPISGDYSPGQFFVTPRGLAILNKKSYQMDNSKLSFDLFSLTKKGKL